MKLILRIFLVILLTTFYLLLPTRSVQAAENFTTAYNVTYTIDETGIAHVVMKVGLTNTTSQYYASSYKIQVGFDELTNLTASDPKGVLTPKIERTADGHAISMTFNERVVGKGNTLPITLSFDTTEIARKRGDIWSITIPGIANQKAFSDFQVTLEVPPSFGKPSFIKPEHTDDSFVFTKAQLGEGGIAMAFGEKQGYDFHLTYHLSNKNIFPIRTEIALPPSTNYQDVFFTSVQPEPKNVVRDRDGNWLATYELKPSEEIDVIAKGRVILSLHPKPEALSDADREEYLKEHEFWQVSSNEIRTVASKAKTPEAIYRYVVGHLQYDFSRVSETKPRLGALSVLQNPDSAVCLEFTDLFIAIARAAGIPAREVNGYAFTENERQRPLSLVKDILHAWPEYYDDEKKTWIMVDPTWGNTTGGIDYFNLLDFDHITFVRKGMDSTYPIPPGGYKTDSVESGKDVHIEFGRIEESPLARVSLTPGFQKQYFSWFPITGSVRIRNLSQGVLAEQTVVITSGTLMPARHEVRVGEIPPNGVVEVPIHFDSHPTLTKETHTFTIQTGTSRLDQTIELVPFFIPNATIVGGIIIAILVLVIFIIAFRTRHLPFFRRK